MGWETVGIRTALCVAGMIRGELMARTFDQGNWKEIVFQYLFETFSNRTAKPQSPQSPPLFLKKFFAIFAVKKSHYEVK